MIRTEEARQRYYDIILRETMRLSRLIDDLMELSRLQSGKISIDKQIMPLSEMILDLSEKYSATAEDRGQKFNLLFDANDCPQVFSNPDRVEQVLVILLDNAMKYTPEGGEIFLNARWNETHVVLSVRDTGIGISESDLPYVFDRFYKADKSRTGSSGSGLGLSIAREMLRWMGEEIFVTSEKDKGSEFSFTLKRHKTGE
jgi:signal transduction histidine kinase